MKLQQFILIVMVLALVVAGGCWGLHATDSNFNLTTLFVADGIMALLSIISYGIVIKQAEGRPQAFVTSASASSLLKLMICGGGILAYALLSRPDWHKPTIFVLLGIYFIFTLVEKYMLGKAMRSQKG